MKTSFLLLLLNFGRSDHQNDYCSYLHSQHVLDRIASEVVPIFNTYGISMVQNGVQCQLNGHSIMEDHLKRFGNKSHHGKSHECDICKKKFQSEDYLEFHMKVEHFSSEKLQDRYHRSGTICPAELCDIFECPELPDQKLRFQTYTQRSTDNYEGKISRQMSYRERADLPPFRYQMTQEYDDAGLATLL